MFRLAEGMVARSATVVGSGEVARSAALEMVRRGWLVILIAGTGGVADDIAAAIPKSRTSTIDRVEPALVELVADGSVDVVELRCDAGNARRRPPPPPWPGPVARLSVAASRRARRRSETPPT